MTGTEDKRARCAPGQRWCTPDPRPLAPALEPQIPREVLGDSRVQIASHVGPLRQENALHHRIARRPIFAHAEVTDDAVLLRTKRLNRPLRPQVETVRAEADDTDIRAFRTRAGAEAVCTSC